MIVARAITEFGVDESACDKVQQGSGASGYKAQKGDIIIATISGAEKVRAAINQLDDAVLSSSVLAFRLRAANVTATFLVQYLKSNVASLLLSSTTSTISGTQRLTIADLRQLPVPIALAAFSEDLSQAAEMELNLRRKADDLTAMRHSFFDATSIQDCETRSVEIQRAANIYSRSLEAASTLQFQVANFYPFPIAYGFRQLESIHGHAELYREQLRVAENVLAFLASIALSLVAREDRIELAASLKAAWGGGISPGSWKDLLQLSSKLFSTKQYGHSLCQAFVKLNVGAEKRGFGGTVLKLIQAKNDFKHDRGPIEEVEIANGCEMLKMLLDGCFMHLAFTMDFPIHRVIDFELRRGTAIAQVKCAELAGDHPALPQRVTELPSQIVIATSLQKGDLYVDIGRNQWIDAFPFVQTSTCPRCKTRETYFLDKIDWKSGVGNIKSFERGHSESVQNIKKALEDWVGYKFD